MAQYDGSIRINTQINTKNAEINLSTLENRIVKTSDKIASLQGKLKELKADKSPTEEYTKFENQLLEAYNAIEKLEEKQKLLSDGLKDLSIEQLQEQAKTAWSEFDKVEEQLSSLDAVFSNIESKRNKLLEESPEGIFPYLDAEYDKTLVQYEKLQEESRQIQSRISEINKAIKFPQEIEKAKISAEQLEEKLKMLEESGKAFTFGKPEEIAKTEQQLKYAENDLSVLNQKHEVLGMKLENAKEGYKKLGNTAKKSLEKINKSTKKTGGLLGTLGSRFKSLALSLLIFNRISKAVRAMSNALKEGFPNLYNDKNMTSFKGKVDNLRASILTLKNAFAAAFRPLVEVAIPYLQKAIEYLTEFIDKIGQIMAAISGQKNYTKAIKQTADAFKDAEKKAEGYLSPLDEINKFSSNKGEEENSTAMFEEVPIDNGILDFVQKIKDMIKPVIDYAQKLKDIFAQGFMDGLGDWEYRWESIKDSISSIKNSLVDIFTDSSVVGAADKWAQSVSYVLGSLAGSVASIGLTIATNLLGGISTYLEQNKDRIKKILISMFDIWDEINQNFAEFFQSIAYVFEAFASENGQQLTANIIGIFADAFMGITELASKTFRDVSNIIIQPFVDNKEEFRTALEGFLGVLSEVTGTIKQGIDETFDKLNEVYDTHFKPMFDSIAQGLSDTTGKFLEFWNGTVQPILEEWAQKFDVLWKEHIQPFLNKCAELFGSIADLIKALWENILKPFIDWLIQNVLPAIMPVIENIYNTVVNVIGGIIDYFSGLVDYFKGVIDFLTGVFSGDWEKAFTGISEMVTGAMEMIQGTIETVISIVGGVINGFLTMVKSRFDIVFSAVKNIVKVAWDFIKKSSDSFVSNFKSGITNGLNSIKNAWNNVLNGIKTAVQNVFGSILKTITGVIDTIKNAFNSVASWFSGLFGGGTKSVSATIGTSVLPISNPVLTSLKDAPIPGYATGQVIPRTMKQHLAWLGDNNRETEVVSPLSTIEQAVENVMARIGGTGGNIGGTPVNLILQVLLDSKVVGQTMVDWGKLQQMATGKNPYELGTT